MSDKPDVPPSPSENASDAEDAATVLDREFLRTKLMEEMADSPRMQSLGHKDETIDRYRLVRVLGKGGFGIVWHAVQTHPIRRDVALKIIKPGMDSVEIVARFEAERQSLALMDHPNIASVLDAGTTSRGRPYFVMELVMGCPITEYCDTHRLGIRERLELFIPVCMAVQHAHQKAILHRDLKPSNILVTEVDGKPVPKVIDFGIAKALRTESSDADQGMTMTREGMVVGTPQYMSPEQAGSMPDVDTRSDVYTLGIILHEMLTGETPLSRDLLRKAALHEVLRIIRESETRRPSSGVATVTEAVHRVAASRNIEARKLGAALRGDLDWILLKALEKDRERRYDSANALARDLQRSLHDEPVSAGPPTLGYRIRKFARRKRRALAISGGIGICLIGGAAFGTRSILAERAALEIAAERGREAQVALGVAARRGKETQAALEQNRRTLSTSLFVRAEEYWKNDRVPLAVANLTRALASDPANAAARRLLLGLLLQRSWAETPKAESPGEEFVAQEMPPVSGEHVGLRFQTESGVKQAFFSPDSASVVTVGNNGLGEIHDASSGRRLHVLGAVNSATFLAGGVRLLTTSDDGRVTTWNVRTGKASEELLRHGSAVSLGAVSNDEKQCVIVGADGAAFLCSLDGSNQPARRLALEEAVKKAAFHPDGSRVLIAGEKYVSVTRTGSGEQVFVINVLRDDPGGNTLRSVAFDPSGSRILTSRRVESAQLWDAADGRLIKVLDEDGNPGSDGVAFSPDGARLATLRYKATSIEIWKTEDGELISQTPEGAEESGGIRLFGLQYSPSGLHVAAYAVGYRLHTHRAEEHFARLWDGHSSQVSANPMAHGEQLTDVRFSKDGAFLLTAANDKVVQIWDVLTGMPVSEPLLHLEPVKRAEFSGDGASILTLAGDSAYLWNLPRTPAVVPEWFLKFAEKLCGYRITESMAYVRTREGVVTTDQLEQLVEGPSDSYRRYAEQIVSAFKKSGKVESGAVNPGPGTSAVDQH